MSSERERALQKRHRAAPLRRLDKNAVVDKYRSLIQGRPSDETLPRRDGRRCIGFPFAGSSYSRFGYAWTIPIIVVSSPRRPTTDDGRAAEKAPSKKKETETSDKICLQLGGNKSSKYLGGKKYKNSKLRRKRGRRKEPKVYPGIHW